MDFEAWRCKHEKDGDNLFCPVEGCSIDDGCARDHGWRPGLEYRDEFKASKGEPQS